MARTYTVGIYYVYVTGDEGSSDTTKWHSDWETSWCLLPIVYETALFANYTGGSMPIQWVKSYAYRRWDFAGGESLWKHGGDLVRELQLLSSFDTVDIKIVVAEDYTLLAPMYAGLSTIFTRGSKNWQTVWGKQGVDPYRDSIADYVAHELGHLFGLKHGSTTNKPCPMVPGINWESYQQWLEYGQQLWFHPEHRIQLLESWGELEPPTVTVNAATSIQATTATINAAISKDGGEACEYRFRYAKHLFIPGDANEDGVVNALDITKIERIIAGLDAETPGADANQDGVVNALDITKVERIIAGLDAETIIWDDYTYTIWTGSKTTGQTFYEDISGLDKNSVYRFDAQAKNSAGEGDWGGQVTFSTLATAPTVTTQAIVDVETIVAVGGSNITDTGGQDPDEEGICWNTCGNPTVADNKSKKAGSFGTGEQSNPLTGLIPGETYYIRGFATNLTGTGYGSQVVFTHNPSALIVAPLASIDSAGEIPAAGLGVTMLPYTVPIAYVVNPIPTFTRDNIFEAPTLNIDGLALIPVVIQALPPTAGIDSEGKVPSIFHGQLLGSPLVSTDSEGLVPEIFDKVWVIIDVPTTII